MFREIEDIEAWKRGCRLAVEIYHLTEAKEITTDWGLKDQLRRSAISISSNIAEGYERNSQKEFRRFLFIAKGSCAELRTQLYILKALEKLPEINISSLIDECREISAMLQTLASSLTQGEKHDSRNKIVLSPFFTFSFLPF